MALLLRSPKDVFTSVMHDHPLNVLLFWHYSSFQMSSTEGCVPAFGGDTTLYFTRLV